MTFMIVSVLGVIWTTLGTIGTFYYGRKSSDLERKRNSFSWQDVERGALGLLRTAERTFHPEIILTMSGPGAAVTSLAMSLSGRFYPVYTAMLEDVRGVRFHDAPRGYLIVPTKKWNIHLPEQLCGENDKRIMVIDDCVISGDVQSSVCHFLVEKGYTRENIYFAVLVSSTIAVEADKGPDFQWYVYPRSDFYFPWGRWF